MRSAESIFTVMRVEVTYDTAIDDVAESGDLSIEVSQIFYQRPKQCQRINDNPCRPSVSNDAKLAAQRQRLREESLDRQPAKHLIDPLLDGQPFLIRQFTMQSHPPLMIM